MEEFSLITPTFLFSAISLIMLAYTNRFISYAQLVRTLKEQYIQNRSEVTAAQIKNLKKRLYLTRNMQVLGISSLFFCVVSMFLVYIGFRTSSVYIFGFSLLLLIASLGVSIAEILISVIPYFTTADISFCIALTSWSCIYSGLYFPLGISDRMK